MPHRSFPGRKEARSKSIMLLLKLVGSAMMIDILARYFRKRRFQLWASNLHNLPQNERPKPNKNRFFAAGNFSLSQP
jgi:hypothetical protein